jgi:hypothetical protein
MTEDDSVREFLSDRGCPDEVVTAGLDGLVSEWERAVVQVESGYPLGLDDYLNDLDGRQLLEDALEVASEIERAAVCRRGRHAYAPQCPPRGRMPVGGPGRRPRGLDAGAELVVLRRAAQARADPP